ncbi:hypothetical protein BDW72DRAFT_131478 [Aspergillus terricola var. indicus]
MNFIPWTDPPSHVVYVGISDLVVEGSCARLALVVRNGSDLVSFFQCELPLLPPHDPSDAILDFVLRKLLEYRNLYDEKFAAVAFPRSLADQCPSLSLQLWKELDAVPYVVARKPHQRTQDDQGELATFAGWEEKQIDEKADSIARKCIRSFGIGHVPPIHLDLHGMVAVDMNFRVPMVSAADYEKTVEGRTWSLVQHYAGDLRKRQVRVAFFSATAYGRPDVYTRHALIRLSQCLGVDFRWYVPRPRPQLLYTIRRVQRILHCVETPTQPLTTDEELRILEWVYKTAQRYWLSKDGPLLPASEGGADVVVIGDAILSSLALIAKQSDPQRPVIFENRLHVHYGIDSDHRQPENQTFEFLRERLRDVDLLVSQEPKACAPRLMPIEQVGYMPVAVDQLDGLHKPLHGWDISFYGRELNAICRSAGKPVLDYPRRRYFLHLTQLIPYEGTIRLLDGYQAFFHQCQKAGNTPGTLIPQLLLCHSVSATNPETAPVHASLLSHIQSRMPDIAHHISLVQVRPPDQLWNSLMCEAVAIVQLCDYEGIPEMLLGAVHMGKYLIVSREFRDYQFLQNRDRTLFLDGDEVQGISKYLVDLGTDSYVRCERQTERQTERHSTQVPGDRATTVGNALNWFFLASKLSRGEVVALSGGDIFALAEQSLSG